MGLAPMVQIDSDRDIDQMPPKLPPHPSPNRQGQMRRMGKWRFHKTQPAIGPLSQTKNIGRLRKLLIRCMLMHCIIGNCKT